MDLIDDVARASGAALVTITHDPAIAARASLHLRLDHGALRTAAAETAAETNAETNAEPAALALGTMSELTTGRGA